MNKQLSLAFVLLASFSSVLSQPYITTLMIRDGTILDADINASAAIAGSKISPFFTSNIDIAGTDPALTFGESLGWQYDTSANAIHWPSIAATKLVFQEDGSGAIGGSSQPTITHLSIAQGSTFTASAAASAHIFRVAGTIVGTSGSTHLHGGKFTSSHTTQTAAESITEISTLRIDEPDITNNLIGPGVITTAASLMISDAPSEGVSNYALFVDEGDTRLDGALILSGTDPTITFGEGNGWQYNTAANTINYPSIASKSVSFGLLGTGGWSIGGNSANYTQLTIGGQTFTSGGLSTIAIGVGIEPSIVGAVGDTSRLSLMEIGSNIGSGIATQSANETVSHVASVIIAEPNITDNLTGGGVITNASTLTILSAPTEGTNNYALFVDDGTTRLDGVLEVRGTGPHMISTSTGAGFAGLDYQGDFTSDGSGTNAYKFRVGGSLTGANGDTATIVGTRFATTITTQSNSETIPDVASVMINEPGITIGTDTITNASSLKIVSAPTEGDNNYALFVDDGMARFDGQIVSGGAGVNYYGAQFAYDLVSGGGASFAAAVGINSNITGFSGDTTRLSLFDIGNGATITTQGATDTITDVASIWVQEPGITVGSGDVITTASTVHIQNAPDEGQNNYALFVDAGDTRLDGRLNVGGSGSNYYQHQFSGAYTSGGDSTAAASVAFSGDITGASGDISWLATIATGINVGSSIVTQSANENIAVVAGTFLTDPGITDNLLGPGVITDAATLVIDSLPNEGVSNHGILIKHTGSLPGITMDSGSGNSPQLRYKGGTNDDIIDVWLGDNATPGNSDLFVDLADDGGGSAVQVRSLSNLSQVSITSNGAIIAHTGNLRFGTTPATTGTIRLENATSIQWRDVGDTANIQALAVNASDEIVIGGGATAVAVADNAAASLSFYGAVPAAKPTVSGARSDPEQALADLLAELATLGLITNSTTGP